MVRSKFFWLNTWDFIKGLIVAILTAVITFLTNELAVTLEPVNIVIKKSL